MGRSSIMFAIVVLLLASSAVICGKKNKANNSTTEKVASEPTVVATGSGLKYIEIKVGEGRSADNGMKVRANYSVWLDVNGEKGRLIDSSVEGKPKPEPLEFTVGMKGLIAGWNEGMLGMKVGGKRRLYVPSALGYGAQGRPPMVPGNSDLIFDIELLEIL